MKNYFLIVDSETTQDNLVADFGAVICDAKGNVLNQCAVLIGGIYNSPEHPLFFDSTAPSDAIWSKAGQDRRYATYNNMLQSGSRMLASVNAVNNWLAKAASQYNPILTAYNLPFDRDKCSKTGIDLSLFSRSFCLWAKAWELIGQGRDYKKFVLANHLFNSVTTLGNMTYKCNAETVAGFLSGTISDEPHTALEDVLFYELPILKAILKRQSVKKILAENSSYNWRNAQVRDHFSV